MDGRMEEEEEMVLGKALIREKNFEKKKNQRLAEGSHRLPIQASTRHYGGDRAGTSRAGNSRTLFFDLNVTHTSLLCLPTPPTVLVGRGEPRQHLAQTTI